MQKYKKHEKGGANSKLGVWEVKQQAQGAPGPEHHLHPCPWLPARISEFKPVSCSSLHKIKNS